ncbi:hypothetical protein ABE530_08435 [Brucella sp. TWI559]
MGQGMDQQHSHFQIIEACLFADGMTGGAWMGVEHLQAGKIIKISHTVIQYLERQHLAGIIAMNILTLMWAGRASEPVSHTAMELRAHL